MMEVEENISKDDGCKIRCSNIPEEFLKKSVARQHFEQFGEVLHMIIKPKSKICYVHYKFYKDAQSALFNGGYYLGKKFNITIHNGNTEKRRQSRKDFDPDWVPDPEIQHELDAMSAIGDNRVYSLRPGVLADPRTSKPIVKKTIKRNWIQEKPKSKAQMHKKAWTSDQLELLNTLKQVANTVEEKYKVLEARDKLMRLRGKKLTDLTNAMNMIGTCPDMCPEKERLQREIQHQVAYYEQDALGKCMNPYLAIKQYSRSSADQETPLPHELRPVSVLELSMGYLMHNIMDLCDFEDVNLSEWYHFLWDRTRSIRKDITQQELCCHGSVALIEQCARFHIHCSARLVAEDPSVFDQKINTENLTKCLQTLKYMYHDLHLKGESCKNEAEFRSYIILLNLNDGNFMWEVQQLKLEIQKSPEIKFALKVYSALNKNNFVKFFKLVRSTNYLNACILLRYFVQVRSVALSITLKSYSPRTPYTLFSLQELQQLLAFEDQVSMTDFLASYGLYLNQEETQVILDRKSFQEPEIPVTLDRAINVVESKLTKTVGETVCGGVLPPPQFNSYVPHNSFNENGTLIMTDSLTELVEDAQTLTKTETLPTLPIGQNQQSNENTSQVDGEKTNLPIPFWSFNNESKMSIFKTKADSPPRLGIFGGSKPNVVDSSKQLTFKPLAKSQSIFNQENQSIFTHPSSVVSFGNKSSSIFAEPLKSSVQGVGRKHAFNSAEKKESIFNVPQFPRPNDKMNEIMQTFFTPNSQQESKTFNEQNSGRLVTKPSIFGNAVADYNEKVDLGVTPLQNMSTVDKAHFVEPNVVQMSHTKEEEAVRRSIEKQVQEQKDRERLEQQLLEDLRKAQEEELRREEERRERVKQQELERKRIEILIEKERLLTIEIKKSVTELMNDLLTKVEEIRKQERLKDIAINIKNSKMRLFLHLWKKKVRLSKRKRHAVDQNPVWLPARTINEEAKELITSNQDLALQNIKRYKSGKAREVLIPEKEKIVQIDIDHLYKLLLESYAKLEVRLPNEFFWKATISIPDFQEVKVGLNVIENVLIQYFDWKDRYGPTSRIDQYKSNKCFGYCVEKKQGVLEVDGNSNGIVFFAQESNDFLYQRISTSVKNFPNRTKIAVVVVFVNNNTNSINSQILGKQLEKNVNTIDYKVIVCQFNQDSILNAIKQSLDFLAQRVQPPPPLQLDSLAPFTYNYLCADIWKRMTSFALWNSNYRSCLKSPNLVIKLYNEGIDKIKEVALDHSCFEYPDFAIEFSKFLSDKTPEVLPCDYRYFPSFWRKATYQSLIRKALNSLKLPQYQTPWPPANESDLEKDIYEYCSKVFDSPQSVFYKIMVAILKNFDPSCEFEKIKNVLWIDIIEVIGAEKLRDTNFLLHHTEFHSKSIFQQLFIVYNVNVLEKLKTNEWFYLKNSNVKSEIKKFCDKMPLREKKIELVTNTIDTFDLDELERSIREAKIDDPRPKTEEIAELECNMKDLEKSMEIHKRINLTFQTTIKQALGNKK